MNGRERFSAVMQGQPFDQRPFFPLLSLYGAKLSKCPLRTYYTDPSAYARGQQAIVETFDPDVVVAPFAMAGLGEAFGGQVRYFDDQPPNLVRPAISSAEEVGGLTLPDPDTHPTLLYYREALRALVAEHGRERIIAAPMLGPFDLPIMIMGLEAWLESVLFSGDQMLRVLEVTIPFVLRWVNALVSDGASALVLPSPFLTPTVITSELAERVVIPAIWGAHEQLPCPVFLHSVGGPFLPLLRLLAGLPNVAGAVVDEGEDLTASRDALGPTALLFGGLDGGRSWRCTPEQIETSVRQILLDRKDDPRFVFATLGADVAWQTRPQQIHAIQRAIAEPDGG